MIDPVRLRARDAVHKCPLFSVVHLQNIKHLSEFNTFRQLHLKTEKTDIFKLNWKKDSDVSFCKHIFSEIS